MYAQDGLRQAHEPEWALTYHDVRTSIAVYAVQHTKLCANMQFRHDICASAVALLQEQQQQGAYLRSVNACMQHNAPEGDTCDGSLAS